jgi:transposase
MSISELKHVSEPVRRIEVFTGAGRRRSWTAEEKAALVAESAEPGATVCAVARRHGLTPQQLFAWRRVLRTEAEKASFVPVVLTAEPEASAAPRPAPKLRRARRSSSKAASIELEIDGVAVRVGRGADAKTVAAVIRALKAGA